MTMNYDSNRDPNGKYFTKIVISADDWIEVRAVRKAIQVLAEFYSDAELCQQLDKAGELSSCFWSSLDASYLRALDRLDRSGKLRHIVAFYNNCGDSARDAFWAPGIDLTVFQDDELPWRSVNDADFDPIDVQALRDRGLVF